MKYMGSKSRIAKYIVPIIQKYIDDNNVERYVEPFVGGANVIDKIKCKEKYGSDNHRYLIALLQQAAKDITVFPVSVTKDEYNDVKRNKDNYPDWYVGLVGFCASYNAKYFGGYANNVHTKIGTIRNYTDEAIRNLIKQSDNLKECIFSCNDFREIRNIEKTLIYCDPPYKNTTKYKVVDFPYDEFYEWCREMSKDNIVLISEYSMPNDFKCIWQKQISTSLNFNRGEDSDKNCRIEKLFIYNG